MTRLIGTKRKARYFEGVISETGGSQGIWCPRLEKYVKPKGWIDGVTKDECDYPPGKPKYISEPPGLGSIDG